MNASGSMMPPSLPLPCQSRFVGMCTNGSFIAPIYLPGQEIYGVKGPMGLILSVLLSSPANFSWVHILFAKRLHLLIDVGK